MPPPRLRGPQVGVAMIGAPRVIQCNVCHKTHAVQGDAEYYRRIGQFAEKLPYQLEQRIARMLAAGHGVRVIKERLGVGQSRIERIQCYVRSWVPESKWSDD